MQVLAVIPARGGSKGVPRKNVLQFGGMPLIAHMISEALSAKCVDRLVVSTDDAEIAEVAQRYGGEVVWRPEELCGDSSSSESALLHCLEHMAESEGYEPDILVFLQCTSPLTQAQDIDGAVQALLDNAADTAVGVTPFHYFVWQYAAGGNAVGVNHDKSVRLRRQEQEPQFLETGAVYVMRCDGFKKVKHRFFGKTVLWGMPKERCVEIDEYSDFVLAEKMFYNQKDAVDAEKFPDKIDAVIFDFDGVFTDNKVTVCQDGTEMIRCDRSDGLGLSRLKQLNIPLLVLSSEKNPVATKRCEKLGIECIHGTDDKVSVLSGWLAKKNLDVSKVVFVGNDRNDVECMRAVGCAVAVADAYPIARDAAQIVLTLPGGKGAIRELVELILNRYGKE